MDLYFSTFKLSKNRKEQSFSKWSAILFEQRNKGKFFTTILQEIRNSHQNWKHEWSANSKWPEKYGVVLILKIVKGTVSLFMNLWTKIQGIYILSYPRNALLEKTGLKPPKALKTGTTICGIVYKVGLLRLYRILLKVFGRNVP